MFLPTDKKVPRASAMAMFRARRQIEPDDILAMLGAPAPAGPKVKLIKGNGLDLAWSASRWHSLAVGDPEEDDYPPVSVRTVEGWFLDGNERVGYLLFLEYRVAAFVEDDEFWMACDGYSAAAANFGQALLSGWPACVSDYGLVVEFSRLWVRAEHARASGWAEPVRKLFASRWSRRGPAQCALLLLKPFPLELEGSAALNPRAHASRLAKRSAAMRRLYARELGVQPLRRGEWMWRTFADRAREPTARARRWTRPV